MSLNYFKINYCLNGEESKEGREGRRKERRKEGMKTSSICKTAVSGLGHANQGAHLNR